jgi:ribosomal protein S18 acetylase RimI-like enzyme
MPIRARKPDDMAGCVTLLRTVHEVSGYPSVWPPDPAGWLEPASLVAAWVAETGGLISGHVALVQGAPAQCLLAATGRDADRLGRIVRLYVDPAARRQGLARGLLEAATVEAREHGLRPVLNVMADGYAAIALYERSGWKLAGTQPATWTTPDGVSPMMRYYVGPSGGKIRP